MVEGPAPRKSHSGDGWRYSDRLYSASPFRGADGTLIDSRKAHREYMARHNLTTADDYQGEWQRAARERAKFYVGDFEHRERREAVERAILKLGGD